MFSYSFVASVQTFKQRSKTVPTRDANLDKDSESKSCLGTRCYCTSRSDWQVLYPLPEPGGAKVGSTLRPPSLSNCRVRLQEGFWTVWALLSSYSCEIPTSLEMPRGFAQLLWIDYLPPQPTRPQQDLLHLTRTTASLYVPVPTPVTRCSTETTIVTGRCKDNV